MAGLNRHSIKVEQVQSPRNSPSERGSEVIADLPTR